MTREELREELIKIYIMPACKNTWNERICKQIEELFYKEPCEDAISRQAVKRILEDRFMELQKRHDDKRYETNYCLNTILELPLVISRPKTGHWIDIMVGDMPAQACDQCNTFYPLAYTGGGHKYCPNCGAKMEDKE